MTDKLLAYLQLVRVPNVFTAIADVLMGFLVTHPEIAVLDFPAWDLTNLLLLCGSSASLYTAGIVLNDVCDVEIDRRERPERPIPSGRVPWGIAFALALGLLLLGVVLAWIVSARALDLRPGWIGTMVAGAVFAYDAFLKRTPFGPLGMGVCRQLNVLLGMSLSLTPWLEWNYLIASGLGIYIIGVTWFARTEATSSNRLQLMLAVILIALGINVAASYINYAPPTPLIALFQENPGRWFALWLLFTALVGWRCVRAVIDPQPQFVQAAVRQCIISLIIFDAVLCYGVQGTAGALVILPLLIPTAFLGRFIYST